MKVCPSCGNSYPDDANFCPMDATRLPAAVVAQPAPSASSPADTQREAPPAVTQPNQPAPVGGRFVPLGISVTTPTGVAGEATDVNTGATIVLKQVPDSVLPTATMADRALRELKQLGKVASDRIVRVLDQGRTADGHVYVATEKVDGISLEELVQREGPLAVERAKSIVLQVGEALTEAQKVGVIHRDVSPRNVMVMSGDRVKVADFGLAEPVVAPSGEAGKVFGAAAYLSPEQAEGKPVDQRSNIYSLGAVYYFALTGAPPFAGDNVSLLQQHLNSPPAPPSTKRVGLGSEIDRVILKALEKNGGRRHLTLRQLLNEVQSATEKQQGPLRAASHDKTLMPTEAPPQAQPMRAGSGAATMMGIPAASPVAAMGPPPNAQAAKAQPSAPSAPQQAMITAPTVPEHPPKAPPIVTAPSMPAAPPMTTAPMAAAPPMTTAQSMPAAPQAVPERIPSAPQPVPQAPPAPPEQKTLLAEAPQAPPPQMPSPPARPNNGQVATPAATGKKGAFRETAWFKRGEIEEEMAKAQAAAGADPLKSGTTGQHAPVDENAVPLSAQDHQRLSLKTGATQAMPVIKAPVQALPGERMDEHEMLAELDSSRKWLVIAGVLVVAVVIGLVIYFATRPAPKAEAPPAKPEAVAAAPPTGATTPPPSPAATATPPAATPPPPTTPTNPPTTAPATPTATAPKNAASATEALVARLEASGDKREIGKLERSLEASLKQARKHKDAATAAQDEKWLARLKRARKK
jgi:serine/threonine protein kinase